MPTTVNNTTNNQCTINNTTNNNYITNYFQRCQTCQPVEAATADAATTTEAEEPEEKKRPQENEEEPNETRESKKQKSDRGGNDGNDGNDEPKKKGRLMTSFFSRVDGPTAAEGDTPRAEHLFPVGDRYKTFEKTSSRGKKTTCFAWIISSNGNVRGHCTGHNCGRGLRPMADFEPRDCNKNARKKVLFQQAMEAFKEAHDRRDVEAAREARAILEETRSGLCSACRHDIGYLSPAVEQCKTWWDELRKRKCAEQNGCANPDCDVRGPEMWMVLEGDHVHGKRDEDESKRKVEGLGDYVWWSYNGGVPAMEAELAKGMRFICRCCHALDDLSPSANRYKDPDTMPNGKQNGTRDELRQNKRKWKAKNVYYKQQYVDNRKRQIGCCANCRRKVPDGKGVVAFDFDHRDESTKLIGKGTLAGEQGGVSGIVHNHKKGAALDAPGVKKALNEEMDKCNLLCRNCHHVKTYYRDMMDMMKTTTAEAAVEKGKECV